VRDRYQVDLELTKRELKKIAGLVDSANKVLADEPDESLVCDWHLTQFKPRYRNLRSALLYIERILKPCDPTSDLTAVSELVNRVLAMADEDPDSDRLASFTKFSQNEHVIELLDERSSDKEFMKFFTSGAVHIPKQQLAALCSTPPETPRQFLEQLLPNILEAGKNAEYYFDKGPSVCFPFRG